MAGEPALSIVPPTPDDQKPIVDPTPASIGLGDVFDEDRQKELYRTGVEALAFIAKEGNDNARMGAAAKLVDLFKKTAQRNNKIRKIRVAWRNPLDTGEDEDDDQEEMQEKEEGQKTKSEAQKDVNDLLS